MSESEPVASASGFAGLFVHCRLYEQLSFIGHVYITLDVLYRPDKDPTLLLTEEVDPKK